MKVGPLAILGLLGALSVTHLTACDRAPDAERAFVREREKEQMERQAFIESTKEAPDDEEVIKTVLRAPSSDGAGTTGDWIDRNMAEVRGSVLFPRWKLIPRGANKYEIRYLYTQIDANNQIRKKGWAWKVDMVLQLVSSPSQLSEQQIEAGSLSHRSVPAGEIERELHAGQP